jgi:hypothetical protein
MGGGQAHTSHLPKVQARVMWGAEHLALMFRVEDHYVRAVANHPWNGTDSVCTDSCVEFFVSPVPGKPPHFSKSLQHSASALLQVPCISP